jgi:hypothetical protein
MTTNLQITYEPIFRTSSEQLCPGSTKLWRQPSNQLRGARGASGHACSTGLSTGRRLMPMTARCGAAAPCRGATTVRVAVHETSGGKVMAVWIAQSACSCSRMRNSWQSRPRHVHQCVPHNQPRPCIRCSIRSTQSAAGSASATVWIATSFRPRPYVFVHTLACQCS